MGKASRSFIANLAVEFPVFQGPLIAHLAQNDGEILPHLAMDDFYRVFLAHADDAIFVKDLFCFFEKSFDLWSENHEVSNVIAVSFIENLLFGDEDAQDLIERLPQDLALQYEALKIFWGVETRRVEFPGPERT